MLIQHFFLLYFFILDDLLVLIIIIIKSSYQNVKFIQEMSAMTFFVIFVLF